jgi:putative metallohydrolase (TIGR04338 family)
VTPADPQRSRVYEAEGLLAAMIDRRADFPIAMAFGSRVVVPEDRKFGDIDSVQRYVDAVLQLGWVLRLAADRAGLPVRVRARAGATRAEYDWTTHTIAVPPHRVGGRWAMRELVILHEVAHHLTSGEPHGAAFVATFVRLVDELVGTEAAFLLRSSLLEVGVALS